jgi:hypothetical protein
VDSVVLVMDMWWLTYSSRPSSQRPVFDNGRVRVSGGR